MRISDWSSDVCSSDLADALFLTDLGEFPGDFRGGGGVVDEDRALAHPGEGAVVAEDDAEIGRAACRERVCQYVEISVVAVSLKKKHKNIYVISRIQVSTSQTIT